MSANQGKHSIVYFRQKAMQLYVRIYEEMEKSLRVAQREGHGKYLQLLRKIFNLRLLLVQVFHPELFFLFKLC